jgi:D-alanyl-D-alanine carboxypeptidase
MKTGYTKKSKYSLVATAHRDNKRLMSVVLGAENKDVRANVAAQMLNRGFSMLNNGATPVSVTKPVAQSVPQPSSQASYTPPPPPAPTQLVTTFNAAYNAATSAAAPVYSKPTTSSPVANSVPGSAGVQFGAFSSRSSAETQVQNVKNKLGVNAVIETASNGMYRVRVNGLSESAAQQIKSNATANGIDSYVFH